MGCGASNTLETSEFKKNEQTQKTNFLKIMENYKSISTIAGDIVQYRNSFSVNDDSMTKMVAEYKEAAKDTKLKDDELKDCFTYALLKKSIIKTQKNVGDGKSFLDEIINKFYDEDKKTIANKIFKENTGEKYDVVFVELEEVSYLKHVFRTLKYDPEYLSYTTFVLIFDENAVDCIETMRDLASLLKVHPLINFIVGLGNTKLATNLDNISLLFEALPLSKTVKNFSLLRIEDKGFTLKPESNLKIVNAIAHSKVKSIGLIRFTLPEQDRTKLFEAIAKNSNISLVGIQDVAASQKEIELVASVLSKSKTLRCLLIGAKEIEYEATYKKNKELFKGNSKFEELVFGFFKN